MAIESAVMFRRVARIACLVLLAGLLPSVATKAQLPIKAPAPVTAGSVIPFSHGGTGNWIQIYSMNRPIRAPPIVRRSSTRARTGMPPLHSISGTISISRIAMALPSNSAGFRTTLARGHGLSTIRTFGKVLATPTPATRRCRFRPRISRLVMTASPSM